MTQTLRIGVIGGGLMGKEVCSAFARWCHLSVGPIQPVVTAICARTAETRAWFTQRVPTITVETADYRQVLASPEVDVVYCAVPHDLHREMYVATISADKHLLGEKPFGIDREANAAIAAAAAQHPELVVRCSSEFPFYPGAQRIVRYAQEERFGTILEVEAGLLHSSDLDPLKPLNWKREIASNGEYGCMGDLGMHVLHLPLRLGWRPRRVHAILSNIVRERPGPNGTMLPCQTWDNAMLLCDVAQNDAAFPMTLKAQRIAPGEVNTWYLTVKGTQLSVHFSTKHPRTLLTMPYTRGEAQAWRQEDLGSHSVYPSITGAIFEFGFSDAILQMLAAFFDQVGHGPEAEVPFGCATVEETRLHHEVLTAALASHAAGQVVALPEDEGRSDR
jgi:predicted dehydrogenase